MNFVRLKNNQLYKGICSIIDHSKWRSFSRNKRIEIFQNPNHLVYFEFDLLKDAYLITQKFTNNYQTGLSSYINGVALDSQTKVDAHASQNRRAFMGNCKRN